MKELRKHYWKAFLALIKAYKRYYLGAWIIKLPFYKLTSNQHKFTKWQAKRDERLKFFHNALQHFKNVKKFFKTYYEESKKWLDSPEFKAKYLDTKHPYPPFLNPNMIDYESIPAEIAWEMNLPLPHGYKFICIMASFNGHTAMVLGLKKCGVCIMGDHIGDIKAHYIFNYTNLLLDKFVVINATAYNGTNNAYYRDLQKLILMTSKTTPILMLCRDPISRLKSSLNNSWSKASVQNYYNNSTLPCSFLENRIEYHIDINLSILNRITYSVYFNTFAYATLYEFLCKFGFSDIDMLDISSIEPNKAFDTFCKLANKYGFAPPNENNFLPRVFIQEFSGFLPLRYTINGTEFIITPIQNRDDSMCEVVLSSQKRGIYIYTAKYNADKINNNTIRRQLIDFIDKLIALVDFENKYHKTNESILIRLICESKNLEFMREILRQETQFIQNLYPDIVESWKYYNEFEKICAELDKKESKMKILQDKNLIQRRQNETR